MDTPLCRGLDANTLSEHRWLSIKNCQLRRHEYPLSCQKPHLCSKLFEIELEFIDLSADESKTKREASKEHEIWNQVWETLDMIPASKTSLLEKAVTYAQNQKPYMENYFLDGSIPISNNFTESCGARSRML